MKQNKKIGTVLAAASITIASFGIAFGTPSAQALPGQCVTSGWGGFCDYDAWSDGSYMHKECGPFGICNSFRACHVDPDGAGPQPAGRVATDYDPNTPC